MSLFKVSTVTWCLGNKNHLVRFRGSEQVSLYFVVTRILRPLLYLCRTKTRLPCRRFCVYMKQRKPKDWIKLHFGEKKVTTSDTWRCEFGARAYLSPRDGWVQKDLQIGCQGSVTVSYSDRRSHDRTRDHTEGAALLRWKVLCNKSLHGS